MSPRVYKKPRLSTRPMRMDLAAPAKPGAPAVAPAEEAARREAALRERVNKDLAEAAARQARELAESWEAEKTAWFAAQEKPLVELALQLAARICRVEVKERSASAAAWAREGLARLGGPCVVAVHPQDAKAVGALEEVRRPQVTVEVRPELEPGDVLIDTPSARFDARLSTRLDQAAQAVNDAPTEEPRGE